MSQHIATRPDTTPLSDQQKRRMLRKVRRRAHRCGGCGGRRFHVGDALYVGFLFLSEERDAYLVALTCARAGCPVPHTAIRSHAAELFGPQQDRPSDAGEAAEPPVLLCVVVWFLVVVRGVARWHEARELWPLRPPGSTPQQ